MRDGGWKDVLGKFGHVLVGGLIGFAIGLAVVAVVFRIEDVWRGALGGALIGWLAALVVHPLLVRGDEPPGDDGGDAR